MVDGAATLLAHQDPLGQPSCPSFIFKPQNFECLPFQSACAQELESRTGDGKDGAAADAAAASAPKGRGWMAIVDRILGNLQLRLSNVHIRYEDDAPPVEGTPAAQGVDGSVGPGERRRGGNTRDGCVSVGLLLGEVVAHTVDEWGRQAFVTQDVLQCLRKAVRLSKLCAYFDVSAPRLQPPGPSGWKGMSVQDWDRLFLPDNHHNRSMYCHDFLLCPVSGDMQYNRRAGRFRSSDAEAKQALALVLQRVQLQYSRQQYASTQRLLQVVELYQANAPFRHLRPAGRPAAGAAARVWWRYALKATRLRLGLQKASWGDVQRVAALRRR